MGERLRGSAPIFYRRIGAMVSILSRSIDQLGPWECAIEREGSHAFWKRGIAEIHRPARGSREAELVRRNA
jgi:hypothetical protein